MIRIKKNDGVFIKERRLSFFKEDMMLPGVCLVLFMIPNKFNLFHMYIVRMRRLYVKMFLSLFSF